MADKLLKTPLYQNHLDLKARMVPFAGYEMPVQYSGLLSEVEACRKAIGLFDVSHMGQFRLVGKNPLQALQKLVTNDLSKIQLGQAQYNMLCNPEGGVIDDLIIYRQKEEETYICVNASNRKTDFEWMKKHLPSSVKLTDESDETALIAVQGPRAEELIAEVSDRLMARQLKYYWAHPTPVLGKECYLSRTGYTGEDGFELYLSAKDASFIWNGLLEKGKKMGITPCGLGARDTLRLEMGYPLHGHELSPTISPLSANLGWVVKLQIPAEFIGKEALKKEAEAGPKRILRSFIVEDRRIARQGYRIFSGTNPVGEITSGTMSPHTQKPICLGFVDSKSNEPYTVEIREAFVPLKRTPLPFVTPRAKRNTPLPSGT